MKRKILASALPLLAIAGCATPDLSRRAMADLHSLVSDDDYPVAAIAAEEQGTTGFYLDVGPDGRVTNCTITVSSGSAALDAATCRLLRSRAVFTPARDKRGRPTTDRVHQRVIWVLPED